MNARRAALPDAEARRRALTDFSSTLMVEAGAGTGKTSILAGRVVLLLASGAAPAAVAAITYTELAANELAERVRLYADALLDPAADPPEALALALPQALDGDQRAALETARANLDALTATTIHGFCRDLLGAYAVEADIDPGAQVIDQDAADLMYRGVFDRWLTSRLSDDADDDDGTALAVLSREDPLGVVDLLWGLAKLRRRHRSARPPPADLSGRPDRVLADAVDEFQRWQRATPEAAFLVPLAEQLGRLNAHYDGAFATRPDFARLWALAHPPELRGMRWKTRDLERPETAGRWRGDVADRLEREFNEAFDRVDGAYRDMMGKVTTTLVADLSCELDALPDAYDEQKRAAAVLDFDDLISRASRLLSTRPDVREAVAARYRHLLVDEFQDTDPAQCDIIFRIGATGPVASWDAAIPRPGALFLVGDPKQALYMFRGAEVSTYEAAKAVVRRAWPDNILQVTSNFRTVADILRHVNRCFEDAFAAPGQPDYVPLAWTREDSSHGLSNLQRLTVQVDSSKLVDVREAEAAQVGDVCLRLIGDLIVAEADGTSRAARPGDIALLAPAGTQLWRYERALQERGLPFVSRAGKGFYRRQEIQDLVALTCTLADATDTLALGALLRGPLVGLTEEVLLDVAAALPDTPDGRPGRLSLLTPPDQVADPHVRGVLETLRSLRRRARLTSPVHLLIEAVEALKVRAVLTRRDPRRASAANANVDLFLERAAAYGVRGLARFAQDLHAAWRAGDPATEGRVDAGGAAIEIISIHSAKGLEWPIVIPINGASELPPRDRFVHRPDEDTVHWMVGDVAPPALQNALHIVAQAQARERVRLWYVACTRARDLLVLPGTPARKTAYCRAVDLRLAEVPEADFAALAAIAPRAAADPPNTQDTACFTAEAALIAGLATPRRWLTPSAHDVDRVEVIEIAEAELYESEETIDIVGGRFRGLVLHKLMEEVLGEGLAETEAVLSARATELVGQLGAEGGAAASLVVEELARTTLRTLALPEIAELRPQLVPELPIYATLEDDAGPPRPLGGRADAVAISDGCITTVVDWKSDLAPSEAEQREHLAQLRLYLEATGAARGGVVYMSVGLIRWIAAPA